MGTGIASHPQTELRMNQAGLGIPGPAGEGTVRTSRGTSARNCAACQVLSDTLSFELLNPGGWEISTPGLREVKRLVQDGTTGQRRSGVRSGSWPRTRTEGGCGGHRTKDTAGQLSAPFMGQEGRGARSRTCHLGHPLLGPPRHSLFNRCVFLQWPSVTPRGGSSDRLSSYQILPSKQVLSHL